MATVGEKTITSEAYYIVTAHPPTSVSFSVKTNFTSPHVKNLILAQATKITIYDLTANGIVHRLRLDLFGRVAVLIPFQPEGLETSLLFVLTEKRQFFTLAYDAEREVVITKSCGDFSVDFGLHLERGLLARLDPNHQAVFLFLSQGSVKILPLVSAKELSKLEKPNGFKSMSKSRNFEIGDIIEPRDHMFELQQVIDVAILTPFKPEAEVTMAVLYSSGVEFQSIAIFRYNPAMRELYREERFTIKRFCRQSYILLPLPNGGILCLGDEEATYTYPLSMKPDVVRTSVPQLKNIQCCTPFDTFKGLYLIGDIQGNLSLMSVTYDQRNFFSSIKFTNLGTVSIPSSMCYLDSHYLFVGSHYGESQLVKLLFNFSILEKAQVEIVETISSISPILDLTAVDFDSTGLDQVVTCSGGYREGRLHVLRSGAGYEELAALDLKGISGVWSFTTDSKSLAISFLNQTRIIDSDFQETVIPGLAQDQASLVVAAWESGIVQVTDQVALHVTANQTLSFSPPSSWCKITTASISNDMVVIGGGKGELILLTFNGGWVVTSQTQLPHEIACINMNSLGTDQAFCSVGLWVDPSVYLLQLPSLKVLSHAPLPGEIVPRSMLQIVLDSVPRLLIAMADGRIFFFQIDLTTGTLSHPDCFAPGTQTTSLVPFIGSGGENLVLSVADRCAVIYPHNDSLVFAYINERGSASHACLWHSEDLENTVLFANYDDGLSIGRIKDIRQLHVRSIPLGEFPCRLAPMTSNETLAAITTQDSPENTSSSSKLRLFHSPDLTEIDVHVFPPQECALSIICTQLSGNFYYVVGTVVYPDKDTDKFYETSQSECGFIHLFEVRDQKLHSLSRYEVQGGVHCLQSLRDRVVASVNGKVSLFKLLDSHRLEELASYNGNMHVVSLDVIDNQIIVGDLTRSCHILELNSELSDWKASGQDQTSRWITAAHPLKTDTVLVADAFNNITIMKHQPNSDGQQVVARYHLGDQVNRIVKGSLLLPPGITSGESSKTPMQLLSSAAGQTTAHDKEGAFVLEDIPFAPVVLGTVSGMVSLINPLPPKTFHLLRQLERNLLHYLGNVGNLQHRVFRAYQDNHTTQESLGFIDGDVIELFLRLGYTPQLDVIRGVSNQHRERELPPLQQVKGLAGGSWRGLSATPIKGVSYSTAHPAYVSERKISLMTGREVYDDENLLDVHQPHPIPISHTALLHLLNDLSRIH